MTGFEYKMMETNVCYYSKSPFGGYCVIKKTAETEPLGDVRARFKDGRHIERHHSLFDLGAQVDNGDSF